MRTANKEVDEPKSKLQLISVGPVSQGDADKIYSLCKELGTFNSYGEEQLQIVEAPDWVNLSVIATFNPPNKKPVQVAVDSITGVINVPKEATADLYGVGTIVFVRWTLKRCKTATQRMSRLKMTLDNFELVCYTTITSWYATLQ